VAAVALSACETSTGVMHPVEEVARVVKGRDRAPQLWVDGITAVGVCDLAMDALGLDALVMGSQKVFALPPGLAMVAVREQTLATAQGLPRYSLDLQREWAEQRKGQTLFTPATGLLMALAASLRGLRAQGLEATWARHDALAKFARAGLEGLGLRLVARRPASAVSAAWLPEGVDARRLLARCQELGTVLADGQGPLAGKIVRVGHLGSHTRQDLILALANLGQALREQGALDDPSAGVRAALL
jgi:aspartate aminotransferase-like enzyme